VRVNANGSRVAILATRFKAGSASVPDSKLYVWFVDLDKIQDFDFGPLGQRPTSVFWDPVEPRLLACDTISLHKGGTQNNRGARKVTTLFVTPQPSIVQQDSIVPKDGYQDFMGIQVPS
jgi:hypothetical protein